MQRKRIEIETTDGTAWLDRLTPRMMIAIGDRVWSEKRKRLIDDLKDAEVDSASRIVALRELDNSRGMMSEVVGLSPLDRKSTRLNSSHIQKSRMPSSA